MGRITVHIACAVCTQIPDVTIAKPRKGGMMKIKKLRFKSAITPILVMVVCLCMLGQSASALSSSQNILIIGGNSINSGGYLPVAGMPATMSFTQASHTAVSATYLSSFDTVVINVASADMGRNIDTLTVTQKQAIVNFVAAGGKLIIYDSECSAQNYGWLPYPFTTNNPGAAGATGTLTIVENNTLSNSTPASPYYIDAAYLGSSTDAVGDMNVMTTYDSHWCLDMSGTNTNQITGPVHTYAKYPAGTDVGLIIYNGLDMDYSVSTYGAGGTGSDILHKIWLQELQQSFNPSNLPCGFTVVGISLTPNIATNLVGTSHTVTATAADLLGTGQPGIPVTFTVTGVNPTTGSGVTDANGHATFTYTGTVIGTDTITASIPCQTCPGQVASVTATKIWEAGGNGEIPEFPTIALPIAAIIGLAFFFQRRK